MVTEEKIRVIVFLTVVFGVYVIAAWLTVRWIFERLKLLTPSFSKGLIVFRRILWILAGVGFLCVLYGYFVEPYWPSISVVQIKTEKLKPEDAVIRIVQISDLHSDPKPRLEERLPGIIQSLKPDVIVFTGDCVNSPEGLAVFKTCLTQLAKISPTFVVKGNWDVNAWRNLDLFTNTGATELDGEIKDLQVHNHVLSIGGLAVSSEEGLGILAQKFNHHNFNILLYHYPVLLNPPEQKRVDLVLTGHVHGGQVALPFYGAIMTLSKYGKKYEAGLYKTGATWLYVNRGIGMEGGKAPRVRFWARPEITVFEIVPAPLQR